MLRRHALVAMVVAAASVVQAVAGGDELPPSVAWVAKNAKPFDTVSAGNGFDDLAFFEKTIGDARVVGLGEATHGTREHFQMKHRLLEFLATKMGFNVFALEANMPEAYRVDRYVSGGEGDPAALIGGMYFWTWNTEEVLDMVRWMHDFNVREAAAKSGRHVRFAGFDMQSPEYPQQIVRRFVAAHDAAYLPELDKCWKDVSAASRSRAGRDFGVTNAFVPAESVRGKKLRFSGYVRTEDVQDGWAGLWLRIDTHAEPNKLLDNMHDRGPKGTTAWTSYSVEFQVPEDASCVVLGTIFVGTGRAWFDTLQIEVDGEHVDGLLTDPSFESSALGPFPRQYAQAGGPSDSIGAVDGVAKDGKRSLLMRRETTPATSALVDAASVVFAHLRDGRRQYVETGASATDADWTIQNARVVVQATTMFAAKDYDAARDAAMAENVQWIRQQDPTAKIVLWAHNGHVSTMRPWMGSDLRNRLGGSYVSVGFMAGSGTYYAMGPESAGAPSPHVHRLQEPVEFSAEWTFRNAGMPLAILDLRPVDGDAPGTAWMSGCKFGRIGALRRDDRFDEINLRKAFDVLIYVDQTTAARQLKTPPAHGPPND